MIKTITEAILDGYGSGESSFLVRYGQSEEPVQINIDTNILNPILTILDNPAECAVLTITGHSDRVDTEGLTREQRREQEFQASAGRANDAAEAIKQIIRDNRPALADFDLDQLQQLAILLKAAGASVLIENAVVLSEEQRRRNRRVKLVLVRFQPG